MHYGFLSWLDRTETVNNTHAMNLRTLRLLSMGNWKFDLIFTCFHQSKQFNESQSFQLFAHPGKDESASTFITDKSGGRLDAGHPVNLRISYTVRLPAGQPRVTVFHWNTTVPEFGVYQVAGMEQ